jgi:hypothetical protein
MSRLYDRVVGVYGIPDLENTGQSRRFASKITGGQETFSNIYSGRRVRGDDFKRFYGVMVTGDRRDVRRKAFRGIL